MIEITITPLGIKSPGRFKVRHGDRLILKASRQPLLDAARIFLAEGVPPETRIAMRHEGSPHVALSSSVGGAAKLEVKDDVDGPRFVPFYDRQGNRRNDPPSAFTGGPVAESTPPQETLSTRGGPADAG